MTATTMSPPRQAPPAPKPSHSVQSLDRKQLIWTIVGVMLGLLLSSLDQTIVGTALPKVIADLHGFDHYSWVVTAYLLTSTTAVPIFGKLSDIFGRKWIYIGGITLFLIGSAMCGAAQTMTQLILFRGFQGIGAGIMAANAFAIIGDIFPPAERGKWQGIFSSIFGLSSVIGPALGGWITDVSSWRWVFYINVPIGIIALAVLIISFPNLRTAGVQRVIDWWGVATLIGTVVPLLLALSWAGAEYAWGSVQVLAMLALALVMLVAFIFAESRAVEPVIPLDLFKSRMFNVSIVAVFVSGLALFAAILYIPLFVQGVIGKSAASSGAILTPFMLSLIVGSTLSGQLISRLGRYKVIAVVGAAVMVVGAFLLTRIDINATNGVVIADMIVTGFGTGLCFPVFTIAVQNAFPASRLGVVTSATQFFRQIGGTLGAAVMGSLLTSRFASSFQANLPDTVRRVLPADALASFNNPQVLVSAQAQAQLQALFAQAGPQGAVLYNDFVTTVRVALADGVHVVFIISVVAAALAFVTVLFLPEVPLRRSNRPVAMPVEGAEPLPEMDEEASAAAIPAGPAPQAAFAPSTQGANGNGAYGGYPQGAPGYDAQPAYAMTNGTTMPFTTMQRQSNGHAAFPEYAVPAAPPATGMNGHTHIDNGTRNRPPGMPWSQSQAARADYAPQDGSAATNGHLPTDDGTHATGMLHLGDTAYTAASTPENHTPTLPPETMPAPQWYRAYDDRLAAMHARLSALEERVQSAPPTDWYARQAVTADEMERRIGSLEEATHHLPPPQWYRERNDRRLVLERRIAELEQYYAHLALDSTAPYRPAPPPQPAPRQALPR